MDLFWLRISWWIKGWDQDFSYSPEEVLRNPECLLLGATKIDQPKTIRSLEWEPPTRKTDKWNVDASRLTIDGEVLTSIGGVLRDHNRNILCLFSIPVEIKSVNEAEYVAIEKAIELTSSRQWPEIDQFVIESDSKNAVGWCLTVGNELWSMGFTANSISKTTRTDPRFRFQYKNRESNSLADGLAKRANVKKTKMIGWI